MQDNTLAEIFKKVENSVVQITSTVSTVDNSIIINGQPLQGQSSRLGSGFVYDKEGRIITNNHVVEGSKTVDVTFIDGNTYTAKVVGTDPDNDIAVIQIIDNYSDENLIPLTLGNSTDLQVGQPVIAIGNPFGLSDTVTTGIISAIGRLLPNENVGFSIPDVIQTDAAINPGNSGGPLLDTQGQVIGITTAIQSSTGEFSGIGFAIPSNTMKRIIPALIEDGFYKHSWLGISGSSIDPDLSSILELPVQNGFLIQDVVPNSPAAKAGLQGYKEIKTIDGAKYKVGGDIIVGVDGNSVEKIEDILNYLQDQRSVGDSITLNIIRDGDKMEVNLTLQERPNLIQ